MDVGMMMVFASYGWENVGDDQVGTRKSAWRGSPPISALTRCGRPSITFLITRSAPTICS